MIAALNLRMDARYLIPIVICAIQIFLVDSVSSMEQSNNTLLDVLKNKGIVYEKSNSVAIPESPNLQSAIENPSTINFTKVRILRPNVGRHNALIGENVLAIDCDDLPTFGLDTLSRRITSDLRIGLACLSQIGAKAKQDAGRLLTLYEGTHLNKKLKIVCAHSRQPVDPELVPYFGGETGFFPSIVGGQAIYPNYESWPGFIINKSNYSHQEGIVFHESLHLVGYSHTDKFDVTTHADECCFRSNEKSCELLRHFYRQEAL